MKYLSLLFSCVTAICFAQVTDKTVFSLKPAIGINGCQVHGDNYSGYDKGGLFGGIAVNAAIRIKSSFELGFYFSQKGAKHNENPGKVDYSSYNLRLNYIDMPLLFRYTAGKRYFFTLGPSVAYLINYKEIENGIDITGRSPFNKFEIGINVGLGFRIHSGLFAEIRTSNSIATVRSYGVNSTVYYSNPIAQIFNNGYYNNILTLFLSYKIDKK